MFLSTSKVWFFSDLFTLREETELHVVRQITCFVDPHMHLGTTCDFHKRQSSKSAPVEYRPSNVLFVILNVCIFL